MINRMRQLLSVYLLVALSSILHFSLGLKCDPSTETTCSATCNGTEYDISRLLKHNSPIQATIDQKQYSFEFSCTGKTCGNDNLTSAVCQNEVTVDGKPRTWSCGQITGAIWAIQSTNPLVLSVAYSQGDKQNKGHRRTLLLITVGDSNQFNFLQEDHTATYLFNVTVSSKSKLSPYTGGSSGTPPGIIGWVLISLALICFVTYFIAGGVFMYAAKGARGLEVIPNFEFWKSFPFLLKDGFLLTISPCLSLKNKAYQKI